ncbi:ERCC4-related helicase [Bradyrhizobium yuanmingense]|uniref:DEAD/DEAH box helicase n=1 Tax=Bradyrhizobium yuanmingense TaxID=108015 RepID=UPI0035128BB0
MVDLVPIENAWVCRKSQPEQIGFVIGTAHLNGQAVIDVDFGPGGKSRLTRGEWGCGLRAGFTVQDVPLSGVRKTLGIGTVVEIREIATREQALVQLHESGETIWLPFERLRRIMDPALRYRRADLLEYDSAERVALNILGHALKNWNEATGALDRLDVDPLPHQIALVHRIINSGQTNWLIGDDVGLGKTIEVGLLLAALERKQNIRRILLVVPSGLTRQWKEEMSLKFDRRFLIYGVDFRVSDYREWGLFEHVIVSLDLAKPRSVDDDGSETSTTFGMILAAGSWDVVVFDEAHRLSRDDKGRSTLRFKLAQALRQKTDSLLLLSGTPHQGDTGRFRNLLSLVRPDLRHAIDQIELSSDVVREIVLRNRKIDAVDLNGNFLFRGLIVRRIEITHDAEFAQMEGELRAYLRKGYQAGDSIGGSEGRAVGFVMTIYRKLASSSVAALHIALKNRLQRINQTTSEEQLPTLSDEDDDTDADDNLVETTKSSNKLPFFEDEARMLGDLIAKSAVCMRSDRKGAQLVDLVRRLVLEEKRKVLIFTEYRATQAYLLYMIKTLLGTSPVMIHGGQSAEEKLAAVREFEGLASVLISTQAGGEGLNLHRNCHVMINYDLPWNPTKIIQRIGRLYRYGQHHKVLVFNFHARDTIDNDVVSTLMERVTTIVSEMSGVGPEFNEMGTYAADVMGDILERVDITALLDEARNGDVARTQDRIDAAIEEARKAKAMQEELLSATDQLDIIKVVESYYSTAQVAQIIKRSLPFIEIDFEDELDAERFTLRLPLEMRGRFPEFGARTVVPVTTRRQDWQADGETVLLDFSTTFVQFLIRTITAAEFGGAYASFATIPELPEFFSAFLARYQNDQGRPEGEKLIIIEKNSDGSFEVSNRIVARLLEGAQPTGLPRVKDAALRRSELEAASDRAEIVMAQELSRFRHPNDLIVIAVGESASRSQ